jgi:hypothetical protein
MNLIRLLPEFYQNSQPVQEIQGALDTQAEALWAARDGLMEQLNVSTATWGLDAWEEALGLETDLTRPYDYRRSRILSKLRGRGTTTVAMIQNVAESFSNGEVEVTEYPGDYRFEIKFVGTVGIPPNMDDLTAAIEEIKPAHLDYDYIILYRTQAQLAPYTHTQLSAYSHQMLREGALT